MLFEITDSLCQRYPALDPFAVRAVPADEFFQLVRRIRESAERQPATTYGRARAGGGKRRVQVDETTATGGWY
jgi:hypothetical protein